jgi:hypothetical protein
MSMATSSLVHNRRLRYWHALLTYQIVDGGAWHTSGGAPGHTVPYPDFQLSKKQRELERNRSCNHGYTRLFMAIRRVESAVAMAGAVNGDTAQKVLKVERGA